MCRQRAGCNPGAAKADGQRPWWKLPRRVLGGYVQAKEGFRHFRGSEGLVEAAFAERFRGFKGLKAGRRQARMP